MWDIPSFHICRTELPEVHKCTDSSELRFTYCIQFYIRQFVYTSEKYDTAVYIINIILILPAVH